MAFVVRRWWVAAAGALAAGGVFAAAMFAGNVPLPAAAPLSQSSTVYAADGSTLALYHGTQDRIVVPLDHISKYLQQAVVSAEDRTFYTDPGFSLRGTLRAFMVDVRGGAIAQGGSTITQQYVRGAFTEVGDQRTIARKLKEALLAVKFARRYSKHQILSDYLNSVYFGRGAYGAQAAAKAYFNTPASDLTVGEASYLAGIIRSPEAYQPDTNPGGAIRIRDVVLDDMVQTRDLSQSQAGAAKSRPLPFVTGAANPASGAYFVEYVRRLLEAPPYNLTDQQLLTGGLKIYTTLDPRMQAAAEAAVSSTLTNLTKDPQAALVSMSTDGSIRAMVGGNNVTSLAAAQGFNFATQRAPGGGRQAGSAFKPFTLAAFLQAGYSIKSRFQAPVSVLVTSRQCQNLDGSPWSVTNFDNESFPNDVDVTQATANSVNTVYAQIADKLGPRTIVATAEQIGGWTNLTPVCSITLGTSPVTPLEMARAYATFAGQGRRPDPLAVLKVVGPGGRVLFDNAPHTSQILDANMANTINQVLSQVLINGTASGKGIGRPAAGKTGTTENQVDAWFVGYTPTLSTAVWMGYTTRPNGQTPDMTNVQGVAQVTGGSLPATIWQKYMKAALQGSPPQGFITPTIVGRVLGPAGAPCPGGTQPTADFPCIPPGSCQAAAALTPASVPTATVTPIPALLPAVGATKAPATGTVPSPSPAPAASPGATPAPTPAASPTPCPTPVESLPPDIVVPSPSPSPGQSPVAPAPTARSIGPAEPTRGRGLAGGFDVR
jgi:membrane peptidoglycan carboxypeptidase